MPTSVDVKVQHLIMSQSGCHINEPSSNRDQEVLHRSDSNAVDENANMTDAKNKLYKIIKTAFLTFISFNVVSTHT